MSALDWAASTKPRRQGARAYTLFFAKGAAYTLIHKAGRVSIRKLIVVVVLLCYRASYVMSTLHSAEKRARTANLGAEGSLAPVGKFCGFHKTPFLSTATQG